MSRPSQSVPSPATARSWQTSPWDERWSSIQEGFRTDPDHLRTLRVTVDAILLTHGHVDHVGAAADLQALSGAPVKLHGADRFVYDLMPLQAAMLGASPPAPAELDLSLVDGAILPARRRPRSGCCTRRAILRQRRVLARAGLRASPLRRRYAVSRSVGRSDLWGGDEDALLDSIRSRLLTLPDHTVVIPGPGELTTIAKNAARIVLCRHVSGTRPGPASAVDGQLVAAGSRRICLPLRILPTGRRALRGRGCLAVVASGY